MAKKNAPKRQEPDQIEETAEYHELVFNTARKSHTRSRASVGP